MRACWTTRVSKGTPLIMALPHLFDRRWVEGMSVSQNDSEDQNRSVPLLCMISGCMAAWLAVTLSGAVWLSGWLAGCLHASQAGRLARWLARCLASCHVFRLLGVPRSPDRFRLFYLRPNLRFPLLYDSGLDQTYAVSIGQLMICLRRQA